MSTAPKPPHLQKRILSRRQQQFSHFRKGTQGEQLAVEFLASKNYKILETNIRFGLHEVDIVALEGQKTEPCSTAVPSSRPILVFCEVKTRSCDLFGNPSLAVTPKKIKSMQIVAREYLRHFKWNGEYRFDVIAILPNSIEHYENVTW